MTTPELLKELRERLAAAHGERLRGIILYGSEARGEAAPDSDIDVLVLLDEPVHFGRDLELNLHALFPLSLRLGRRISCLPASAREYAEGACPLYSNARQEGIAA